ncbi:MAG: nitroreductase family protein [Eubacteriales bacterium]|nr:nitroreductase family protein [Eubacteriales bacterium]
MTPYEAIFRRKSVRKYREDEISGKILEKIGRFEEDAIGIRPDIRVKWKILNGADRRLKGLFRVRAPYYVALYSEICEDYRKNAGCLMEQLALYLHTRGIGSCYQGGAKLKNDEERELELVMIMAFGYPAEPLERRYEDFRRTELKRLVTIRGEFGKVQRKLLEAARLAPSAMNLQPWHFVATDGRIHLFVRKPGVVGYRLQQDFNLFDAGVALAHMLVTAEELWFDLEYQKLDSIVEKEFQNYIYVGSLTILNDSEKI